MATFPTLDRSPGVRGFTVKSSKAAVSIASAASGLPVLNKRFTFDPWDFAHTYNLVSQVDMESVMTHYEAHCDIPFDWINTQKDDSPITYEVIYLQRPEYQLDKIRNRWRIKIVLRQYSPL